jgi:hypothetical protein
MFLIVVYIFIIPFDRILRDMCTGYHQDVTSSIFGIYFQLLASWIVLVQKYFKTIHKVGQGLLDLGIYVATIC